MKYMSPKLIAATIAVMIACLTLQAGAAILYQNDFGTDAQFNALDWSSTSGLEGVADIPTPPGDLDGDSFHIP